MVRRYIVIALILLAIVIPTQVEFVRQQERSLAADFIAKGELETARLVYRILSWQNDPVGRSNYHALDYYLAINAGDGIRKARSIEAAEAWRQTGKAGVGASFWNLAMFDIKYGRAEERHDRRTTYWLQQAANEGIYQAVLLLRAGDGEYDRLKLMMEDGDPGAALTWATEMHFANDTPEKDRALRIAADAGSFIAMSDLGWSLINRPDEERPEDGMAEAQRLLETAAEMGDRSAALRLGNCYNRTFYFCTERDTAEAAYWYGLALGPSIRYSLPRITIDPDGAIRLGTMSRWYSLPYIGQKGAAYRLARLLMDGDGVPRDRARAMELFEQADGYEDAEQLLAQLKEEMQREADKD